jgi:hypothetical protein
MRRAIDPDRATGRRVGEVEPEEGQDPVYVDEESGARGADI